MDLKHLADEPTEAERSAIDATLEAIVEAPSTVRQAAAVRTYLLPALHAAQGARGWVSPGALAHICKRLSVPPAEAYGVATFYALFSMTERPKRVVHVCDDIACSARGADRLIATLVRDVSKEGEAIDDATWHASPCLGVCERGPVALSIAAGHEPEEILATDVDVDAVRTMLAGKAVESPEVPLPQAGSSALRLLRRIGRVDPTSLDDYRAHGGYAALRRALELGPAGVIREITEAGLVGRGGAAFPTGKKWEAVAKSPKHPRYVVCNADESEPGTFKDRYLMDHDPFSVIEAMTIAGITVGAERGYLYVRGEYPRAARHLTAAIAAARTRGWLGRDIAGKGIAFDIELRRGAGAYICGEETALFASLEGFRGEPRNKPPFPVDVGLFGKPTVVNNVETLVNVIDILNEGAAAYRAIGTAGSPGTRLFCVAGNVVSRGLYEIPMGGSLRDLIASAGGVAPGRTLTSVLLGGAAGSFLRADELDLPLTFEDTKRVGATLGSGVVLVFDDTVPMMPILQRVARFFRDESCGQCVPCRIGTVRQEELVSRLASGAPMNSLTAELALLAELGQCMKDASICGLGQTATVAIESAMHKLRVVP